VIESRLQQKVWRFNVNKKCWREKERKIKKEPGEDRRRWVAFFF